MAMKAARNESRTRQEALKRRLALEEAYRVRGCPPASVLFDDPPSEPLRRHLDTCPWCREDRDALVALTPRILPSLAASLESAPAGQDGPPAVGDIRRILESYGGWGPCGRHYNAPLVLLVDAVKGRDDAFRAAQVHDFAALKGPGDVALFPGIFAESWNMYAVGSRHLGPLVRRVDHDIVGRIRRNASRLLGLVRSSDQTTLESERPFPQDLKTLHRKAFQRVEKETAGFFASRILRDLAQHAARGRLRKTLTDLFPDPKALEEALETRLTFPDDPDEDTCVRLLLASWNPLALPMAASGGKRGLFIKRILLSPPRPVVDPVWAELTVFEETDKGFIVAGKISEIVEESAEILALWRIPSGPAVAWEALIDPSTGFFRLLFPEVTRKSARVENLEVLVGGP